MCGYNSLESFCSIDWICRKLDCSAIGWIDTSLFIGNRIVPKNSIHNIQAPWGIIYYPCVSSCEREIRDTTQNQ